MPRSNGQSVATMEVERIASDSENVAVDGLNDSKLVVDEGAGDAAAFHAERLRRKNKKFTRTNSKEKDGVATTAAITPLPKYRSWKNSRRPRNGHGRGLPKKGKQLSTKLQSSRLAGEISRTAAA